MITAPIPYRDKSGKLVPGIVSFHPDGKHHIRCEYCCQFSHIVKQYVTKKPPAITTTAGTRFYSQILNDHLDTDYHKECKKQHNINSVETVEQPPMEVAIAKANQQQIDYVSKLMIQVYLDAKKLNLAAYSWPARYIAAEASTTYDSAKQNKSIVSDGINLQYVNPHGHLNLMTTIVRSHRDVFLKKINECNAISLRIDGSIDLTQIDKIYVMAKLINLDGSSELIFIGVSEQKERFAKGLMLAVIDALKVMFDDPSLILKKISSLCTDGTNVNTGAKNSLWALIDDELKKVNSQIPLLKIWCAAHRSELAWKNTAAAVPEIGKMLSILSNMATYFHFSAIRSSELKQTAKNRGLRLLHLPKIFTIRWTEFSFKLLNNVLLSWQVLVIYFQNNIEDAQCAGFLKYLTSLKTMKMLAFLADLLFTFERFQKKLQSDRLTLIDMKSHVDSIKKGLNEMKTTKLLGGFEFRLADNLVEGENGTVFLKSIELTPEESTRTRQTQITFTEVRENVLNALQNFLTDRFQIDEPILKIIEPFVNFSKDANISEIHAMLAPDLSLPSLHLQFNDILENPDINKDLSLHQMIQNLSTTVEMRESYKELIIVFSRIAANTPHECDVERCISANNLLKTKIRSSISLETENKYLFIHTNMPNLSQWNPLPAAKLFVEEKERRHRDITSGREITKRQSYFKGIFPQSKDSKETECDEYESDAEVFIDETIFDF